MVLLKSIRMNYSGFYMKHKKTDKNKAETIKDSGAFEQLGMDLEMLAGACNTDKDNDE